MPLRLKIILGLMVVIAGFFITRVGLYFKNSAQTANLSNPTVLSGQDRNVFFEDSDSDGIADVDEAKYGTDPFNPDSDGDGYLDGEEVASGFDPRREDKSRTGQTANVTNNFTERLAAGVVEGTLNPRNGMGAKFDEGVDLLTFAAIDDAVQALTPAEGQKKITTTDNSKKSQEEYLKNVSQLLEGPFLQSFMAQPHTMHKAATFMIQGRYDQSSKLFSDSALAFTTAYTKLQTVSPPPKWLDFHMSLLTVFRKMSIDYNALTKIKDDPVLAMASLSDISTNISEIEFSILQNLKSLIKEGELEVPNSPLFNVMDILKSS